MRPMPRKSRRGNESPHWAGIGISAARCLLALACLCAAPLVRPAHSENSPATKVAVKPVRLEIMVPTTSEPNTNATLNLRGPDARLQLLVNATLDTGEVRDFTREVTYEISPSEIIRISPTGRVTPLTDGTAVVQARTADGQTAIRKVVVSQCQTAPLVNFPNQIVPIFTKSGCNAGGCHGKAAGQNGFKLSLLGFEPTEDYEHLTREARGRRLFPAAPERSLLLQKGTARLPHGGGQRLDPESDDYKLIVRWITQGMPYGKPTDPTVAGIEVFPKERSLPLAGEQQLAVVAHYSDGSQEDVTRSALFEPNDKDLGAMDGTGRLKVFDQPGDVAVMIRYQSKVAVFRGTIPLGAPVTNLPPTKNFIDELVFKKLQKVGMPPSENCDDATFVRRASIDIAGRLPTAEETRRFLADTTPGKRDQWIDSLLDSTDYAEYFANKWSSLLRNKRDSDKYTRGTFAFYNWIRDRLLANQPYDQFARSILAASGDLTHNPPVAWYRQVNNPNAQLEDSAQLFLGLRLQCAQCHHHPYEKWSQHDYYSLAAFFSQVGRKAGAQPGEEIIYARRGLATAMDKKSKQPVPPAALGATPVKLTADDDPRQALADWMSSKDNPFFAKALVNRYWKHFFNRGLVDPEDDMRETNPPTNPELLNALADHFMASGFDLKDLIRTICRSQVYQLSAVPNQYNAIDKQYYSRYYPRRMTAEVLLDAVDNITGSRSKFEGLPLGTRAVQLPDNSFNNASYFLAVFGRPEASSSCECERSQDASLAQCLHLLNSKEVQDKLADPKGCAVKFAAAPAQEDEQKIRDLYQAIYSRAPEAREMTLALNYLAKKSSPDSTKKEPSTGRLDAYEDILWALLNTKEFLFNH